MDAERIAELRRVADEATPGPWEVIGGGEYVTGAAILIAPDDGGVKEADGAFIAAARTAVPELLAEVERLKGVIETAEIQIGLCRQLSNDRARQRDRERVYRAIEGGGE